MGFFDSKKDKQKEKKPSGTTPKVVVKTGIVVPKMVVKPGTTAWYRPVIPPDQSGDTTVLETQSEVITDTKEVKPQQKEGEAFFPSKPLGSSYFYKRDAFLNYKRIVNRKLTIVLLENTTQVQTQSEEIERMLKSLVKEDLVCIINYGDCVIQSEIFSAVKLPTTELLLNKYMGEAACLYDALIDLAKLVDKKYMVIEEDKIEKTKIDGIRILGIGTCKDTASKNEKSVAIQKFSQIARLQGVTTKYFCLTEEGFIPAAEIGFRSIGSISRVY